MGQKDSHRWLQLSAECAHHGLREILDGNGRRRWVARCGGCGKEDSSFRSDARNAQQVLSHFTRAKWVLARKSSPYCSFECSKVEKQKMQGNGKGPPTPPPPASIGPNPIIMRRVITLLNDQFDMKTCRYRDDWNDERVAKEAECAKDFVVTYRRGGYGELAEDPMISKLRDDVKLVRALFEDGIARLRQDIEPQLKELDYKLARLVGHKAAG